MRAGEVAGLVLLGCVACVVGIVSLVASQGEDSHDSRDRTVHGRGVPAASVRTPVPATATPPSPGTPLPPVVIGEIAENSNLRAADVQNIQLFEVEGLGAVVTAATVGPPHEAPPYTVEQWRPLVASIFPEHAVDTMLALIACESGGDPNVTGAAGERGLAQIHPLHADSTYDPEGNIRAAYRISSGGESWAAWLRCADRLGLP